MEFYNGGNNDGDSATLALTIDSSQNVTFAGDLTVPHKIIHDGDTDTYIRYLADNIVLYTGGAQRLDVTSSRVYITDSLGVGTSSPDNNMHIVSTSSETGMIIQSNLGGTGSAVGGVIKLALGARNNSGSGQADTQSGDVLGQIMFEGQGTDYSYQGGNIKTVVTTGDGDDNRSNQATAMTFETILAGSVSPAERFRIGENGFVGINRDTDIHERLTVGGMICSTGSSFTSSTAGNQRAILDLSSNAARIGHFRGSNGAGSGSVQIFVDSGEKMRINASGFVGIGDTTSANALLDLNKSTTDANAPTANESYEGYRLMLANPQLTNYATNALGFSMYNGEVCASIDASTLYNGNYETTLRFQTRKDGGGGLKSKLTISPDGETVVRADRGGTGFQIINDDSSTPYGMKIDFDSATPNNTTQYFITCQDSTNDKFIVLSNGNVQSRTDSYGGISDERLKDNIVNATSKLDDLNKVRIVNYNFKDEPDEKQLGVIAQELQKIFPKMVYDYGEEKHLAVKYSIFVPMLIKALQEADDKINALSAKVEELEAKL